MINLDHIEFDIDKFTIFLDIDGVLVSYLNLKLDENGESIFIKESVDSLNSIIEYYDAQIVCISAWNSTWRNQERSFVKFLNSKGLNINEIFFGDNHHRSEYIDALIELGMKRYLVIDDESYEYYYDSKCIEYKRILSPNSYRGLDRYDVLHVTRNFKL